MSPCINLYSSTRTFCMIKRCTIATYITFITICVTFTKRTLEERLKGHALSVGVWKIYVQYSCTNTYEYMHAWALVGVFTDVLLEWGPTMDIRSHHHLAALPPSMSWISMYVMERFSCKTCWVKTAHNSWEAGKIQWRNWRCSITVHFECEWLQRSWTGYHSQLTICIAQIFRYTFTCGKILMTTHSASLPFTFKMHCWGAPCWCH